MKGSGFVFETWCIRLAMYELVSMCGMSQHCDVMAVDSLHCRCGQSTQSDILLIRMLATSIFCPAWVPSCSRSFMALPGSAFGPIGWRYTIRYLRPARPRSNWSTSTTSAQTWHSRWLQTALPLKCWGPVTRSLWYFVVMPQEPLKKAFLRVILLLRHAWLHSYELST